MHAQSKLHANICTRAPTHHSTNLNDDPVALGSQAPLSPVRVIRVRVRLRSSVRLRVRVSVRVRVRVRVRVAFVTVA